MIATEDDACVYILKTNSGCIEYVGGRMKNTLCVRLKKDSAQSQVGAVGDDCARKKCWAEDEEDWGLLEF